MIRKYLKDRGLILQISSNVVLNNGSFYDELVIAIKKSNTRRIFFDFSRIDIIDDCGIKAIAKCVDKYSSKGYSFTVLNPSKAILKLLVFSDIINRIKILNEDFLAVEEKLNK